jgi:hypothetical protein
MLPGGEDRRRDNTEERVTERKRGSGECASKAGPPLATLPVYGFLGSGVDALRNQASRN